MSIMQGNVTLNVGGILSEFGAGLAVVPLIGFLESIAIAKAFARKNQYKVDASQELVALGVANCLSSFVSSYPVTGSFSRTAVNAHSGVATPAGGKTSFPNDYNIESNYRTNTPTVVIVLTLGEITHLV